jgi:hypothetical protein
VIVQPGLLKFKKTGWAGTGELCLKNEDDFYIDFFLVPKYKPSQFSKSPKVCFPYVISLVML